jgi:shikimate kinase
MIVTLIGYRGSGKSTVAPRLAARLGWEWIDADVELERRAGQSIRQIFEAAGEGEFRRRERATLIDLLRRERLVLAAGGGAILNADTRHDLRAAGPVVWLQAAAETLARRMESDPISGSQRPKLTTAGGLEEIRTLLAAREPYYRETASLAISTEGRIAEDIVNEIVSALQPELKGSGAG